MSPVAEVDVIVQRHRVYEPGLPTRGALMGGRPITIGAMLYTIDLGPYSTIERLWIPDPVVVRA